MNGGNPKFGGKLHHRPPLWVDTWGERFHIRIRRSASPPLTDPSVAVPLLESVHHYTKERRWWATTFLLMPDHLHAILSFDPKRRMSRIIGDWKRYQSRNLGIRWQENYFDHRIRKEEGLDKVIAYIGNNPVAKGLCQNASDWRWVTASVKNGTE